jgi:cytidylate kinase
VIITIDGPAGSGKSAAASELAKHLAIPFLDTGAMYRAIALDAMESNLLNNPAAMEARVSDVVLDFNWTRQPPLILLNGRDVSHQIRLPAVTAVTYLAADNPVIRQELVRRQREIGQSLGSFVTEGRDQGSIVFPDADFKFYLDASAEQRAGRRIAQLTAKGIQFDPAAVLGDIQLRDERDRSRNVGPLMRPPDSKLIDTTHLTLDQVVQTLLDHVRQNGRKTKDEGRETKDT